MSNSTLGEACAPGWFLFFPCEPAYEIGGDKGDLSLQQQQLDQRLLHEAILQDDLDVIQLIQMVLQSRILDE